MNSIILSGYLCRNYRVFETKKGTKGIYFSISFKTVLGKGYGYFPCITYETALIPVISELIENKQHTTIAGEINAGKNKEPIILVNMIKQYTKMKTSEEYLEDIGQAEVLQDNDLPF